MRLRDLHPCTTCGAPMPPSATRCEHCATRRALPKPPWAFWSGLQLAVAAGAALLLVAAGLYGAHVLQQRRKASLLATGVAEGAEACREVAGEAGLAAQPAAQLCNNLEARARESLEQALDADEAGEAPTHIKFVRGTILTREPAVWREVGAHLVATRMNCNAFRAWFYSDAGCRAFADRLVARLPLPGFDTSR